MAGLRALQLRMRQCRPGFAFACKDGELGLLLRDGSFVSEKETVMINRMIGE